MDRIQIGTADLLSLLSVDASQPSVCCVVVNELGDNEGFSDVIFYSAVGKQPLDIQVAPAVDV